MWHNVFLKTAASVGSQNTQQLSKQKLAVLQSWTQQAGCSQYENWFPYLLFIIGLWARIDSAVLVWHVD